MPAPESYKPIPPIAGPTIDLEKFREGLRRIVQDPELRNQLEKRPISLLPALGITVTEEKRTLYADKSLTELLAMSSRGVQPEFWPELAMGAVIVGGGIVIAFV